MTGDNLPVEGVARAEVRGAPDQLVIWDQAAGAWRSWRPIHGHLFHGRDQVAADYVPAPSPTPRPGEALLACEAMMFTHPGDYIEFAVWFNVTWGAHPEDRAAAALATFTSWARMHRGEGAAA